MSEAQSRIRTASYSGQRGSDLAAALREARVNQFQTNKGDRLTAQNVIVVLTNDMSNINAITAEAELAKASGITIVGVSITGKVSENQLMNLVSPPWGNSKSYHQGRLDIKNDPNLNPDRTTRLNPLDDFDVECVAARVCQASVGEDCSEVVGLLIMKFISSCY